MTKATINLSVLECCAIAIMAEAERQKGEDGIWSELWARIRPMLVIL